jgi:translation initiation factor IF-1
MPKDDAIIVVGEVKENLGPGGYRVWLPDYSMDITGSLSGKMKRLHRISVLPGDYVDVELNPYDIKKGRIIYRHNPKNRPLLGAAAAIKAAPAPVAPAPEETAATV